jgi:hypothetical protein
MTDEADSYDRIERWSQEHISAGSDFLFDPKMFRQALEEVCSEHQFKFEVSDERVQIIFHFSVFAPPWL